MSSERGAVAATGSLFVMTAPSGAGKTSLVRALLESLPHLRFSISCTTRPRRPGERDGEDYHFLDRVEFERRVEAGDFLEHARVFDHYYGTGRRQVEALLRAGDDVILEIDWQGARQVRSAMPECLSIFILPPSRAELERRLRDRGQDSEAVIARRLSDAVTDMSHYGEFDYLVVNDDFATAADQLRSIFVARRMRVPAQRARHAGLITELLGQPAPDGAGG
ncbi:MAG TPA: guanylate kinase [Gammaproteobacteria bacterium]|nr:guanylate kinase [Gammaproteobacteria bacterium]